MARPSRTAPIDYAQTHDLTYGLLDRATCPPEQAFVLVKDADKKGLRLRITKAGGKHWQFETRLKSGKLFTRALGEWPTVSIEEARAKAHELRGLTEKGIDPRALERQQAEAEQAERDRLAAEAEANEARKALESLTVAQVWASYIEERRQYWGELHYRDHITKASLGGERDPKLEQKLMAERDGILTWMVAGAVAYLREGLRLSPAMKAELATYRKESDLMGEFLQESTQTAPNERVEQSRLYTAWQSWCGFNGVQYGSKQSFTRRLTERGVVAARSNGQRYYSGLKLVV